LRPANVTPGAPDRLFPAALARTVASGISGTKRLAMPQAKNHGKFTCDSTQTY
jgi:hypothetical protein